MPQFGYGSIAEFSDFLEYLIPTSFQNQPGSFISSTYSAFAVPEGGYLFVNEAYFDISGARFVAPIIGLAGENVTSTGDGIDGVIDEIVFMNWDPVTGVWPIAAIIDISVSENEFLSYFTNGPQWNSIAHENFLNFLGPIIDRIDFHDWDTSVVHEGILEYVPTLNLGIGNDQIEVNPLSFSVTDRSQTILGGEGNDTLEILSLSFADSDIAEIDTELGEIRIGSVAPVYFDEFETYRLTGTVRQFRGNETDEVIIANNIWSREIDGRLGDDYIEVGGKTNTLKGGGGNDTIVGGAERDTIDGGADNDVITIKSRNADVDGGDGQDVLKVTQKIWDFDFAMDGDDIVFKDRDSDREINTRQIEEFEFFNTTIELSDVATDSEERIFETDAEAGVDGYLRFDMQTGDGMFFIMAQEVEEEAELPMIEPPSSFDVM